MSLVSTPEQKIHTAPSRQLARTAFVAMLGIYFFSFFHRSAIPGTIFNELQAEWHLSATAIVALGSVFLWVYGAAQLVAGIAIDRYGGVRMLLIGGTIMAIGATLFPLSRVPEMLYVSRIIAALGDSFIFLGIIKEIGLLFEHRWFPMLVGVVQATGPFGGMMAMLPFERATHYYGWRAALLTMGIGAGGIMIINYLILPRLKHFTPSTQKLSLRPMWAIFCDRRNWPIFLCCFINFPVYFVLQVGIGKKFIQDFVGLSSKQAATFTLIMMTVNATVALSSGPALKHTGGRRKPFLILSVFLLLGAILLLLAGTFWVAKPWVFLLGYIVMASSNFFGPVTTTVSRELNGAHQVAQALALGNSITYAGVAVMLTMSGKVLDLFQNQATLQGATLIYPARAYETLFAVLLGITIISVISCFFIPETHRPAEAPSDLPEVAEAS